MNAKTRRLLCGNSSWKLNAILTILWAFIGISNIARAVSRGEIFTWWGIILIVFSIAAVPLGVLATVITYRHRNDPKQGGDRV